LKIRVGDEMHPSFMKRNAVYHYDEKTKEKGKGTTMDV
jgi:hypothetical protein